MGSLVTRSFAHAVNPATQTSNSRVEEPNSDTKTSLRGLRDLTEAPAPPNRSIYAKSRTPHAVHRKPVMWNANHIVILGSDAATLRTPPESRGLIESPPVSQHA